MELQGFFHILCLLVVVLTSPDFAQSKPQAQTPTSCICTAQYDPVCGSDGRTYSNLCQLNCAQKTSPGKLTAVYKGECRESEVVEEMKTCFCTRQYEAECGSDGKTYSNLCLLNCQQRKNPSLRLKHKGPCSNNAGDCECDRNYVPFCGTDNMTYANKCVLDCARQKNPDLGVKFEGVCALPYTPDENGH